MTPWIAARQASLSITNSQSSLKLTSIESVMPSSHLILYHPLLLLSSLLPSFRVFSNKLALRSGGQSIRATASASVLPMNIQGWLPLGWTGLTSLQSKRLSRIFSRTIIWKHQFFGAQLHQYMIIGKTIALTTQTFVSKVISLLFLYISAEKQFFSLVFIWLTKDSDPDDSVIRNPILKNEKKTTNLNWGNETFLTQFKVW